MAITSKLRLLQLTGSVANASSVSTAAEVSGKLVGAGQNMLDPSANSGNYQLPAGATLDGLNLGALDRSSDLSGVMQLLADGLGKITGRADWTNQTPGTIEFGDIGAESRGQNTFDLQLLQSAADNKIKVDSVGQLQLGSDKLFSVASNKTGGTALKIQTGGDGRGPGTHGAGVTAGGIDVLSQMSLLLSSSNSSVTLKSKADGPGAVILSASGGSSPSVRVQSNRFEWMATGNAGDGDVKSDFRIGTWGTYPAVGIGGIKDDQNVTLYAGAKGGQLFLSGSEATAPVGFSCGNNQADGTYPSSAGPGGLALYNNISEASGYVTAMGQSTSLLKAIVDLNDKIASNAEPTLFSKLISAAGGVAANDAVTLNKITGNNDNLQGHKPNNIQVMLNGQLLLSASGTTNGVVNNDGDYAVKETGSTDEIRFGFGLQADDIIRLYYFG